MEDREVGIIRQGTRKKAINEVIAAINYNGKVAGLKEEMVMRKLNNHQGLMVTELPKQFRCNYDLYL